MALISSKLMYLQPMLRFSCKAVLRLPTAIKIPKLESSGCYNYRMINPYLEPASLFSTDSKKPKKKEQADKLISKQLKLPFEKKKYESYTEKQDELILERVKKMGYDNPETWKSLAKDLNVKYVNNIKSRCDLLLKRGTGKLQRKYFTKEEDALILQKVEEMGYTNSETWTTLAIELDRDPTFHRDIKRRYDLIVKRDTKEIKRFTEEDSNFILTYVEKNGESQTTWQELAIKFEMDHPRSIEIHYNNLLKNYVKGKFTKAEDKIILNDVEIHGNELQTFKNLGKKLNRSHPHQIRDRFEYLQNKPSKKPGPWQIEEDQMLMEHFFQGSLNKMNNLDYLDSSKTNDFDQISADIGRSKGACYKRWMFTIVPVLKSDILGLPQNEEWRKDILRYIIEKKFGSVKEIPYNKVMRDVCPGQTSRSLSMFFNQFSNHVGDTPFYENCRKHLNNPHPNSYLGNEELAKAKSEYASQILQIKQKLK